MSDTPIAPSAASLHSLLSTLRRTPPRLIQSPPTQQRRASVALILRMKPAPGLVFEGHEPPNWDGEVIKRDDWGLGFGLEDFFRLQWVNHPLTVPELLFIRRAPSHSPSSPSGHSRWSSHIAFPGGRHEPSDESALYTAFRETWEEIGVDLAEREFLQVGRLDEREITTSLGKRLLMILSPFVFLQTSPFSPTPELQANEVSSIHWIPLSSLNPPFPPNQWSRIEIDISTRLSPRNKLIRWALRGLVGKMEFGCVLLPDEPEYMAEGFDVEMEFSNPAEGSGSWYNRDSGKRMLRLWGLSLGMTLDLLAPLNDPAEGLIRLSNGTSSKPSSPTRNLPPRTPITVTSSFDDHWGKAQSAAIASSSTPSTTDTPTRTNGAADTSAAPLVPEPPASPETVRKSSTSGKSGAGLTAVGRLGTRVDVKGKGRTRRGVGPGVTAVFPRFSYPDVNFWIWVFGRKYRQVICGWEESERGPHRATARRTNWSGAALSTFYSAVRQALVVAIVIRALATGVGIAGLAWWVLRRWGGDVGGREL